MSLYGLLAFCTVYLLAAATPGPGVAAVLARSLAHGMRGAPAFVAGFLVGDLIWFGVAATGLTALAQTAQTVFLVVKYAGVVYLLYLAWRLWTAPARPLEAPEAAHGERPLRLFLGSLALTLGNPKAIMFFVALLPTLVHMETLTTWDYIQVGAVIALILPLVLFSYALAAARARRLLREPRAMRIMNRAAGTTMAGAALVVATR